MDDPKNYSTLRQRYKNYKKILELRTGPHEIIPESLVRNALADQLGIKPEEVSPRQIQLALNDLGRDYPAIAFEPPASKEELLATAVRDDSDPIHAARIVRGLSPEDPPIDVGRKPHTQTLPLHIDPSLKKTVSVSKAPPPPSQEMPLFRWEDIDHRLVILKLTDLAEEMHSQIKADERRIQFENRGNMNGNTVPSLVLRMKQDRVDEWARRVYEIYCDVWQTQGHVKSAALVRAVYVRGIVPLFRARTGAIASEFSRFATRTSFPFAIRDAHLLSLRLNMQRLESRWGRRLEIEAKECEHAERRAILALQNIQGRNVATNEMPIRITTEGSPQLPAGGNRQKVHGPRGGPSTGKPGRRPKLSRPFVECAGTLWQKATSDDHSSVPVDKLQQIASALDAVGYLPPSAYLERKYAIELKAFNSRNSNSELGPIMTWSELISCGDKDHLRGMRRLLSRCAEKLDDGHPLSGN